MVVDGDRRPGPGSAGILEESYQFLFLGIDADYRVASSTELATQLCYVVELFITYLGGNRTDRDILAVCP